MLTLPLRPGPALLALALLVSVAPTTADNGNVANLWQPGEPGERRVYQFGSVVPGQYYGVKHVHVTIDYGGYQWYDSRILFKGDPNLDESRARDAIFLEEATVDGDKVPFGRFDITLTPR